MTTQIALHRDVESQPGTTVNVIFVHGLGGAPEDTWRPERGDSWPDLLTKESVHLRVWVAKLDSKPAGTALSLEESADLFLNTLDQLRGRFRSDALYFVCHSLGGLVFKRAIRSAYDESTDHWLLNAMSGVLFLGTPHSGAWWANRLRWVLGPAASSAVVDLQKNRAELLNLREWFARLAVKRDWKVQSVLERRRTGLPPFFPVLRILVVDPESGRDGVGKPLFVAQNHLDLAKPGGAWADQHRILRLQLTPPMTEVAGAIVGEPPPQPSLGVFTGLALGVALTLSVVWAANHLSAPAPRPPPTGNELDAGAAASAPADAGADAPDSLADTGVDAPRRRAVRPDVPSLPATPVTSRTCRFNSGSRAGEDQTFDPTVTPLVLLGAYCQDGFGSSGVAIADADARATSRPTSHTCELIEDGTRLHVPAGTPGAVFVPVGYPCRDHFGRRGVAVADD